MTDGKKMEAIHSRAVKKNKRSKRFVGAFLILLTVCFLIFMYMNFFNITKIEIIGLDENVYEEKQILEFAGVKEGDNLLSVRASRLSDGIEKQFAYVETAKIKKTLPSTLVIELEFHEASMATRLGDDMFYLSAKGKVLGSKHVDEGVPDGVCVVKTPFILKCIQGETVHFANEEYYKILTDIYSEFENHGLSERITELDVCDKFNISASLDNRFDIVFGSWEEADTKVKLLSDVIKGDLWTDSTGIIDISDSREAAVRLTGSVAN